MVASSPRQSSLEEFQMRHTAEYRESKRRPASNSAGTADSKEGPASIHSPPLARGAEHLAPPHLVPLEEVEGHSHSQSLTLALSSPEIIHQCLRAADTHQDADIVALANGTYSSLYAVASASERPRSPRRARDLLFFNTAAETYDGIDIGKGTFSDPIEQVTRNASNIKAILNSIRANNSLNSEERSARITAVMNYATKFAKSDTNKTNCAHCVFSDRCVCDYISETLYNVYQHRLARKRITERADRSVIVSAGDEIILSQNALTGGSECSTDQSQRSRSPPLLRAGALDESSGSISVSLKTDDNSWRDTGRAGRSLCAKSLLPPFVSRIIRIMQVKAGDCFVDLGCGNGSILFQVAYATGATCIGIEICPHNAQVARDAWQILRPEFERKSGRRMPHVEIITGDIVHLLADPNFYSRPRKIMCSNLLFPKMLNITLADALRKMTVGSSVLCFDDFYPHSRSLSRVRDPDIFRLFKIRDYVWPRDSVEWCTDRGLFYVYTRKPENEPDPVVDDSFIVVSPCARWRDGDSHSRSLSTSPAVMTPPKGLSGSTTPTQVRKRARSVNSSSSGQASPGARKKSASPQITLDEILKK